MRRKAGIAGAQHHRAEGQAETFQNILGAFGHPLMLGGGVIGMRDRHHLDLAELMHPDQPARIAPGRARLGAETRGVGGHPQRQVARVEDLAGDDIGQRHFRGRDQPEAVGGTKLLVPEFRQLAGAVKRVLMHQERRRYLGIAVFLGLMIEHEVGKTPLQSREHAFQKHKPGAGQLCRRREIHQPEPLADRHVIAWGEGETRRRPGPPDLLVLILVHTVRDIVTQAVRQRADHFLDLGLERPTLLLKLLHAGLDARDLVDQARGVLLLALQHADLLGGLVAPLLQGLQLRGPRAPSGVGLENTGRHRVQAPSLHCRVESLSILADASDVMHGTAQTDKGHEVRPLYWRSPEGSTGVTSEPSVVVFG